MIVELSPERENDWDEFVFYNKCSYYFKIAWRNIVQSNFKHQPKYFISLNEHNEIDGILPLFKIKSFLGVKLISLPYCPYGGIIASDERVKNALSRKAIEIGKNIGAKHIELKTLNDVYTDFKIASQYYTFILDLRDGIESIRQNLSKSTKRKINKSKKLESKVTIDSNIDVFYQLYLRHMKNKGTPIIRLKFFKSLISNDPNNVKVATIWYEGEAAASILLLETLDYIVYDRGAMNSEFSHLNLNYNLFWEVIMYYSNLNYRCFDFGRSIAESGTFQFKRSWRPETIKLNYQYYLYKGKIPDYSQSGSSRKILSKILKVLPRITYIDHLLRKLFP